jgi:fermentation-respiration switch protein FrsA (DUF1100 family)
MKKRLLVMAGGAFLFAVFLIAMTGWLERSMIFFPSRFPEGDWNVDLRPAGGDAPVPWIEDCSFTASDGVRLHGWFARPHLAVKPVEAPHVLLWFHGNAGNITHRYDHLCALVRLPIQVFIVDYRGYGKSRGNPSEKGLYLDADAAWDFLLNEKEFKADRVVIFGESLGGAVAVDLAARVRPAGLVLQSTFTSVRDMAARHYPFIPRFLVRTRMDSLSKISRVACPKLFIHGTDDEIVPFAFGRRLYESAPAPKDYFEVPGAMHNDVYLVGGEACLERLRKFISSLS